MSNRVEHRTAQPASNSSVAQRLIDQPTKLSPDVLANQSGALRSDVGILSEDVAQVHGSSLQIQLDARTDEAAKRAPIDLLDELSALGFAWTSIAHLVGVSVPAIRKWRQGDAATGENRRKLARLVAIAGVLKNDHLIEDVASWLDIPLANSRYTGIDVLAAGKESDLIAHASSHLSAVALLDRALPDWRDSLDERFEVFQATDGERAMRMRNEVKDE